ncbi:hypothetical protein ACNQGL_08595 [Flavobacterium sp. LB3P21]|uniref:hypothetical protein n=1 Tax=Flavobacterium sp. LB3P21 TaxID=3401719 RepID=UPI003AAA4B0A
MKNNELLEFNENLPLSEPQIDLFIYENGEPILNPATTEAKRKSTNSSTGNNSVQVIDGFTPFVEEYCKGIRTGKKEFTIDVERVYDKHSNLDFIYSLDE